MSQGPARNLKSRVLSVAMACGLVVAALRGAPPARADLLRIPVREEIEFGTRAARQFEARHSLLQGPVLERIRRVGAAVARQTGRQDMPFTFHLVDDPNINAITFPGGSIYVYRGLMDARPTEDELAAVLGHECAHAAKSHGFKELIPAVLLRRAAQRVSGRREAEMAGEVLELLTQRGLSRQFEYEADRLGVLYATSAGYGAQGMIGVLEFFEQMEHSRPNIIEGLLHTHPPASDRLRRVRRTVNQMRR